MQGLCLLGTTEHHFVKEFQKTLRRSGTYYSTSREGPSTRKPEFEIIVHFNLSSDTSVAAVRDTHDQTLDALQRCLLGMAAKYIHVYCGGLAEQTAALVRRFRDTYDINVCFIDLGVLSVSGKAFLQTAGIDTDSSGAMRFRDSPEDLRITSVEVAVNAIYFILEHGFAFTGTLCTQDYTTRVSLLAAAARAGSPRRHFVFTDDEERVSHPSV